MVKLELPETIRLAKLDEVPQQPGLIERIKASDNNNIVEGYTFSPNTNNDYPYRFFAEINVDNSNLWNLFKAMMLAMPDDISFITGRKDDSTKDVAHSEYQDKYGLYNKIEKYERELTLDGFLKFGAIHQTENYLEEVFVHNAKYIQYWGGDEEKFRNTMNEFSLYEIKNLEFIDSYPIATTALFTLYNDVIETDELLNILRTEL